MGEGGGFTGAREAMGREVEGRDVVVDIGVRRNSNRGGDGQCGGVECFAYETEVIQIRAGCARPRWCICRRERSCGSSKV